MAVIKIEVGENYNIFNELLRDQMRFFNIAENRAIFNCWIHIGPIEVTTHINKQLNIENDNRNWIKLISFSRIDGSPIFLIPDGCLEGVDDLLNHLRENGLCIMSRFGVTNNVFIDRNMFIHNIETLDDNGNFYYKQKESKRVFSEVDPYGEEDWEN